MSKCDRHPPRMQMHTSLSRLQCRSQPLTMSRYLSKSMDLPLSEGSAEPRAASACAWALLCPSSPEATAPHATTARPPWWSHAPTTERANRFCGLKKAAGGGGRLQSDQVNPDTPATVNTKPRDRTYMEQRPQGLGRVGEVGVGSGGWERQDLHCAKHPSNRLIIVEQFGCVHYP